MLTCIIQLFSVFEKKKCRLAKVSALQIYRAKFSLRIFFPDQYPVIFICSDPFKLSYFQGLLLHFWNRYCQNGTIASFKKKYSTSWISSVTDTKNRKVEDSWGSLKSAECLWNAIGLLFEGKDMESYKMKELPSLFFINFTCAPFARHNLKSSFKDCVIQSSFFFFSLKVFLEVILTTRSIALCLFIFALRPIKVVIPTRHHLLFVSKYKTVFTCEIHSSHYAAISLM